MKLQVLVLGLLMGPLIVEASDLSCKVKGRGYLPFNSKTERFIGAGYLFEKGECHQALDTWRPLAQPLICSWAESGWNIYNAETGVALNSGAAIFLRFETCQTALKWSYETVCAPLGTGSGVFDLEHGYFVGAGFFYDVGDCGWATLSDAAQENLVCAPADGFVSVFNRRYNRRVTSELFMTARQCYRQLSAGLVP
ncbi:MAG: hypothetical protein ACK5Y2_04680 [Bdellovibrionales bacterium]